MRRLMAMVCVALLSANVFADAPDKICVTNKVKVGLIKPSREIRLSAMLWGVGKSSGGWHSFDRHYTGDYYDLGYEEEVCWNTWVIFNKMKRTANGHCSSGFDADNCAYRWVANGLVLDIKDDFDCQIDDTLEVGLEDAGSVSGTWDITIKPLKCSLHW